MLVVKANLLLLAGALLACSGSENSLFCSTDSECGEGEVCNTILGLCAMPSQKIERDTVVGSFSCTLAPKGTKAAGLPNIAGNIADELFSFNFSLSCNTTAAGSMTWVTISAHGTARHASPYAPGTSASGFVGLDLSLPLEQLKAGAQVAVGELYNGRAWSETGKAKSGWGTVTFFRDDCPCLEAEVLAEIRSGTVSLELADQATGSALVGKLALSVYPFATKQSFGTPCHYAAECGHRLDSKVYCIKDTTPFVDGSLGFCTARCKTDAECGTFGSAAPMYCSPALGACAVSCASGSSVCAQGFVCASEGTRKGCVPESMTTK
jgi:hypothetical protein